MGLVSRWSAYRHWGDIDGLSPSICVGDLLLNGYLMETMRVVKRL